jgi:hypothetical protein
VELTSLCLRRGVRAVVEHLRTVTDVVEQDALRAEERLGDLDLTGAVLEGVRNRSLQRRLALRLHEQGRFGELTQPEQTAVLSELLTTATGGDLTAERDLFTQHWTPSLDRRLATDAGRRLWEQGWAADQLVTLARLAQAVQAMDSFATGLTPAGGGQYAKGSAVRQIALLVSTWDRTRAGSVCSGRGSCTRPCCRWP